MKTNDLKKDAVVIMRDGRFAVIRDSKKGATRLVEMDSPFGKDIGSVYSADILYFCGYRNGEVIDPVKLEPDPRHLKARNAFDAIFGGGC